MVLLELLVEREGLVGGGAEGGWGAGTGRAKGVEGRKCFTLC